jgi:hypothetical protein
MNASPRFLSLDDVLTLHAIAIEDQGGDPSIRDRGLLESALAMPAEFRGRIPPPGHSGYGRRLCLPHL